MRQAVTLAEFVHPVCHRIGVHSSAVVSGKYEILIVVIVPDRCDVLQLLFSPLAQNVHCERREVKPTNSGFRFRASLIDSMHRIIDHIVFDVYPVIAEINAIPF